jgi:hypothetical protein
MMPVNLTILSGFVVVLTNLSSVFATDWLFTEWLYTTSHINRQSPNLYGPVRLIDSLQSHRLAMNADQFATYSYSPDLIRSLLHSNYHECGLSNETCKELASLRLLRHPCMHHPIIRPTSLNTRRSIKSKRWRRRGKQAGQRHSKQIPVIISGYSSNSAPSGQNDSNLSNSSNLSRFAMWNAQSVTHKTATVCDFIASEKLDGFAITEAWFKGDCRDDHALADITNTLRGYRLHTLPRLGRRGGGICVILRDGFVTSEKKYNFSSFECLELSIESGRLNPLKLFTIYRPQPSAVNKLTLTMFYNDISSLLETACLSTTLWSSVVILIYIWTRLIQVTVNDLMVSFAQLVLCSLYLNQHTLKGTR